MPAADMVKDAIERYPQRPSVAFVNKAYEIRFRPKPTIDAKWVDHIITVRFGLEDWTEQQGCDSQLHQVVQPIDKLRQAMDNRTPDCARRRILKLGIEKAQGVNVVPNIPFVHSSDIQGGIFS